MSNGQLGALLVVAGIAVALAGWGFFRYPQYKFWTLVPANRAHEYMRKPGVVLCWIGIALAGYGVMSCSA
ncbi:MAG: hypothetical protein QM803_00155 [Rhodocyclaceae bacterium]